MPDIEAIKTEAKRVLAEGLVEVVLAFTAGDTPLHPQPALIRSPDEVDDLVYDGLCQNNLATYLTRLPKESKVGMLVRGCENRSVNALVVEKQKKRENLYLIGAPCEGILDWHKIVGKAGEAVKTVKDNGQEVMIDARSGYHLVERSELLHESCLRCIHPNPMSADILIGEPLSEGDSSLARADVE